MIKVCHRQDAKSQVYGELSSLEEPMNTFIMQPNTDFAFATIILQCAFTFHPFLQGEHDKVIALATDHGPISPSEYIPAYIREN